MTFVGWIQIIVFCFILVALTPVLGAYMTRVFNGERTWLSPVLLPVERAIYRIADVDAAREQHWLTYTVAMLLFNAAGFVFST
jgi:K+-transporting ATPase ATPase A chain